jgi:putative DNA primase/helicase
MDEATKRAMDEVRQRVAKKNAEAVVLETGTVISFPFKIAERTATITSAKASEFEMRAVNWFWPGRFALGALSILAGLPEQGKGQTWCYMAARATRGEEWHLSEGKAPLGNVLVFTAEDDYPRTVIPRLIAAGADLARVEIALMARTSDGKERMFNLATDVELLRQKIEEVGNVVLVVIDPVSAYLGVGKVSGGSATDVRGVLSPLTKLAEEKQTAVLAVMHFNKKSDVTNALLRVADSLAYAAAARSVYVTVDDPDNERAHLFLRAKNNLSGQYKGLRYMIGVAKVGYDQELETDIEAPYIIWDKLPVEITATEAMEAANSGSRAKAKDEAKDFLQSRLAMGPVKARDLLAEAKAQMIAESTVKRAKRDLGVTHWKESGLAGEWFWELKRPQSEDAE